MRPISLILSIVVLACWCGLNARADDTELLATLKMNLKKSIDQYSEICDTTTEESTWTQKPLDTDDYATAKGYWPQTQENKIIRDGKRFALESVRTKLIDNTVARTTTASNNEYSFSLDDSKTKGSYRIAKFALAPKSINMPHPGHIVHVAFRGFDEILLAIEKQRGKQIAAIEQLGSETIRVKVKFRIEDETVDSTAEFVLLTTPICHVSKIIRVNPSNSSVTMIEYDRLYKNVPIPTSVTDKALVISKQATSRFTFHKLDKLYQTTSSEEVFYLSHYDLPEPEGVAVPRRRSDNTVLFVLAITTFAVLAFMFGYLRRRSNRLKVVPKKPV